MKQSQYRNNHIGNTTCCSVLQHCLGFNRAAAELATRWHKYEHFILFWSGM